MSTNYYAKITPSTIQDDETDEAVFHIGKTGGSPVVNGQLFPSFAAWLEFLAYAEATILDEYGSVLTLSELRARFEDYDTEDRRYQYEWVQREMRSDSRGQAAYLLARAHNYWVDADGFTVFRGSFF